MTEEEKSTYTANTINGPMKSLIEKVVKNHFGVDTNLNATVRKGGWDGYYTTVTDTLETDVTKKMLSNKLLRSIFKSATFNGTAWYNEEDNTVSIRFDVSYEHPNGGSNGKTIGILDVYVNTGKYKWRKNF